MLKNVVLFACCLFTNNCFSLDLIQVYHLALKNDLLLNQAIKKQIIARLSVKQLKSQSLPKVNFLLSTAYNQNKNPTSTSEYQQNKYSLTVNHKFYDKSALLKQESTALDETISLYNQKYLKQKLLFDIIGLYIDVLNKKEILNLSSSELKLTKTQNNDVNNKFKVGLVDDLALLKSQTHFNKITYSQLKAKSDYLNVSNKLQEKLNTFNLNLKAFNAERISFIIKTPDMDTLKKKHPLIVKLKTQIKQNDLNKKSIKGSNYPSLSWSLSHSVQENSDSTGGFLGKGIYQDNVLKVQLDYSIYEGGYQAFALEIEQQKNDKLRLELNEQFEILRHRFLQNKVNLINAKTKLDLLQKNIKLALDIQNMIQKGYTIGSRSLADWYDSQHNLFNIKKEFISSLHQYILAMVSIRFYAGVLDESFLIKLNSFLEPNDLATTGKHLSSPS